MRSKGPPPQPQPQPFVPAGSGGVPGPAHPGGRDPPADGGLPGSGDRPVTPPPGLLCVKLQAVHQETQETQDEMTARPHKTLIRISFHPDVLNHMEIQTPVVTMVARIVGIEARLL